MPLGSMIFDHSIWDIGLLTSHFWSLSEFSLIASSSSLILLNNYWLTGTWVSRDQEAWVMSGTPKFNRSKRRSKHSLLLLIISFSFFSGGALSSSSSFWSSWARFTLFLFVISWRQSLASYSLLTSSSRSAVVSGVVNIIKASSSLSLHFFKANLVTSSELVRSPKNYLNSSILCASSWSEYYGSVGTSIVYSSMNFKVNMIFTGSSVPSGCKLFIPQSLRVLRSWLRSFPR